MSTIHQEISFNASPERVFEIYMSEKDHSAFTGNSAEISKEEGGAFSCHGGAIQGRNIEISPNKRIVQAWRVAQWPEGVYSIIKMELKADGANQTKLILDHAGYPEEAHAHLEEGWHSMYWTPMKSYLE